MTYAGPNKSSHAERQQWESLFKPNGSPKAPLKGKKVTLVVDLPLCPSCKDFFQGFAFKKASKLGCTIEIKAGGETVTLAGPATVWGAAAEKVAAAKKEDYSVDELKKAAAGNLHVITEKAKRAVKQQERIAAAAAARAATAAAAVAAAAAPVGMGAAAGGGGGAPAKVAAGPPPPPANATVASLSAAPAKIT